MPRMRDLGIAPGTLPPGSDNAITDVAGVRVGHATLIAGSDVRTGVTVVVPREADPWTEPVFGAPHRLNGNGEMTGLEWVRESGQLCSAIALTNTHSVGVVRDALVAEELARRPPGASFWSLPVVAETWDGILNDINGFHVRAEHVDAALRSASGGAVAEGGVGGGTGMICHGFKGGIGTSSRVVDGSTVGVLVQANHGRRDRLAVNGVPVGERIPVSEVPEPEAAAPPGAGSIIVVVATDAPLLPHQCERLAQRAGLGVGRTGGLGGHFSGDLFLCFATGNGLPPVGFAAMPARELPVRMLADAYITPLYEAVVEATEEAIVNALLGATTMEGRGGAVAHALDAERLRTIVAGARA